jgi:5'-nucleotidase / UDP-sugar diphosphatase
VLGNHEFDFGPEVLQERLAESEYAYVNTNVELNGETFPGTRVTLVREVGEITVGFFGLTTPDTVEISSPGPGVAFREPVEAAEEAVAALKDEGADVIVALTHLPLAVDMAVARVEGIDFILGGHDHEPLTFLLGETLIFKSGAQAEYVGVIEVRADVEQTERGPRTTVARKWSVIPTAEYEPDPAVQELIDGYTARLDEELGVVIGTAETELDTRRLAVRTRETNFGNLVADAIREATGTDVAITNGGGIRGDTTYPAGVELTRRDVLTELPFGNRTVLLRLTGEQILAALENGFSQLEDRAGRFPQVSGMTVRYDPRAPAGERVKEVTVGGEPLDPGATYTLATNDFMAQGGDGYHVFEDAEVLIDPAAARLMASQVIEYIEARGGIGPVAEERIVEVGA